MKRYILLLAGMLSFGSVMALEGDALKKYNKNKLSKYKVEELYRGESNLQRTYLGEHWTVLELQDGYKTYALLNPVTNRIKKMRIVSEYCTTCLGKEIRMLEELYDKTGTTSDSNIFEIQSDNSNVQIYIDFDHIDGNNEELYSIIDFTGKQEETLRQQSINNIYYQKRMNRK